MLKLGIHPQREKILVACSGGMDSTTLVHSLHACGYIIQVAHVNYKLRSHESEANETFVSELCSALKIQLHTISFDTNTLLQSNNMNLQELARELRYQWFEKLVQEHHLDFIATAHHADDQAETLINNFIKGSALNGLSGIADQRGSIIRPFLSFSREKIYDICLGQEIGYSTDSSNQKTDYTRNFIRNRIMPLVREINPAVTETLSKQAKLYKQMNSFLKWSANNHVQKITSTKSELNEDLDISGMKLIPGYVVILFEYLRPKGFTNDQVQQVSAAIEKNESGLLLHSDYYNLLVDRALLRLSRDVPENAPDLLIWTNDSNKFILPDKTVLIRSAENPENIPATDKINVARQLMTETLYLRHWKHGDVFFPKGMNGRSKKVSDYFIDSKVNRFDKNKMWLLVNENDEIIWITGMRADQRFIPGSAEQSCWIYVEK